MSAHAFRAQAKNNKQKCFEPKPAPDRSWDGTDIAVHWSSFAYSCSARRLRQLSDEQLARSTPPVAHPSPLPRLLGLR